MNWCTAWTDAHNCHSKRLRIPEPVLLVGPRNLGYSSSLNNMGFPETKRKGAKRLSLGFCNKGRLACWQVVHLSLGF